MLEKYQTPNRQHYDNFLVVVMTAFWLLLTTPSSATYRPKKWEQYKDINKNAVEKKQQQQDREQDQLLAPCQSRQAAQDYFLTFDSTPFLPVKCKSGPGRKKGDTVDQRTRHKVVKKSAVIPDTS